jgi:hypothetical protein
MSSRIVIVLLSCHIYPGRRFFTAPPSFLQQAALVSPGRLSAQPFVKIFLRFFFTTPVFIAKERPQKNWKGIHWKIKTSAASRLKAGR